jgi:hypothetical protein
LTFGTAEDTIVAFSDLAPELEPVERARRLQINQRPRVGSRLVAS